MAVGLRMDERAKTASEINVEPSQARDGDKTVSYLLDQYKLCVEMADHLSARRVLINNSFITMMGAGAFIYSGAPQYFKAENLPNLAHYFQLGITFGCVVLSVMWYATILTYRRLAGAKFRVIQEMEELLPSKPFQMEWKYMRENSSSWASRFLSLSWIELLVPIIAGIIATCGFFYTLYVLLPRY